MNVKYAEKKVKYTESYEENVEGTVEARFKLDANHAPLLDQYQDDDKRYYVIELRLKSPKRDQIEKVTYVLDSSYTVPMRFSRDRDDDFVQEIIAFRNFVLTINIHMGAHLDVQQAWLSALLEDGHGAEAKSGPIREAIDDIKRK
jgi:hypothetical protein